MLSQAMTLSGNFGKRFGRGEVEDDCCLVKVGGRDRCELVRGGVNLGKDMKESFEDADDLAEGVNEFELLEREFGLLKHR